MIMIIDYDMIILSGGAAPMAAIVEKAIKT